jgi:hypothetical protein
MSHLPFIDATFRPDGIRHTGRTKMSGTSRPRLSVAALGSAVGLAVACSGSSSPSSPPATQGACDHYFEVVFATSCSGPTLPSGELARQQARWEQQCKAFFELPGITVSPTQLDRCASAIQALGCSPVATPIAACFWTGTLASGAACNEGAQCGSDSCGFSGGSACDGGSCNTNCGVCEPGATTGQPCGVAMPGGKQFIQCESPDDACSGGSSGECTPIVRGADGATCDGNALQCEQGLYCDATGKCATVVAQGAACNDQGRSNPCAAGLTCVQTTGTGKGTCRGLGQSGATCSGDQDCASGFACSATSRTCGTVTWVDAGGTCSDLARCLIGGCNAGRCPTVLSDGHRCNPSDLTATCDAFATCQNGTCVLADTVACR